MAAAREAVQVGIECRRVVAALVVAVVLPATASCGVFDRLRPPPRASSPAAAVPRQPVAPVGFHPVRDVESGHCRSGEPMAVEDPSSGSCLHLGPRAFRVRQLSAVELTQGQSDHWSVQITLRPEDAKSLTALTTEVSRRTDPQNRVAVVLGAPGNGRLLTAATVMEPISGAGLMISGSFSRGDAEKLVHDLGG